MDSFGLPDQCCRNVVNAIFCAPNRSGNGTDGIGIIRIQICLPNHFGYRIIIKELRPR